MNRAERRRMERLEKKAGVGSGSVSDNVKDNLNLFAALRQMNTVDYEDVKRIADHYKVDFNEVMGDFLSIKESQYKAQAEQIARDHLDEVGQLAECRAAAHNVLAAVISINKTWGFTKSINRFLENFTSSMDYIQKVGYRQAYKEVHDKWDITIEFDDEELNREMTGESKRGLLE